MSGSGVDPGATVEGKERDLEPQSYSTVRWTNTTHICNLERWMHGHVSGYPSRSGGSVHQQESVMV